MPGRNHDDCLTAGHWTPRADREWDGRRANAASSASRGGEEDAAVEGKGKKYRRGERRATTAAHLTRPRPLHIHTNGRNARPDRSLSSIRPR